MEEIILGQIFLPVLRFSPASIIPPMPTFIWLQTAEVTAERTRNSGTEHFHQLTATECRQHIADRTVGVLMASWRCTDVSEGPAASTIRPATLMEVACLYSMSVNDYQTTRLHISAHRWFTLAVYRHSNSRNVILRSCVSLNTTLQFLYWSRSWSFPLRLYDLV